MVVVVAVVVTVKKQKEKTLIERIASCEAS